MRSAIGNPQSAIRRASRRVLLAAIAWALLIGALTIVSISCQGRVEKDAVRAEVQAPVGGAAYRAERTEATSQASGPQAGGSGAGWTLNVGTVVLDGGTLAVLTIAAGAVVALAGRFILRSRRLADFLVDRNFSRGIGRAEADAIQAKALAAGIERPLRASVGRVRRRRRAEGKISEPRPGGN